MNRTASVSESAVTDSHGLAQFDFGFVDESMFDDDSDEGAAATSKVEEVLPHYVALHHSDGWFHTQAPTEISALFATKFGPNQIRQRIEHDYLNGRWGVAADTAAAYLACLDRSGAKAGMSREILEVAARCALKQKDHVKAVEYVERLGNSNEAGHHHLKGLVYHTDGRYWEALEHQLNYLELRRRDPSAWTHIADSLMLALTDPTNDSSEVVRRLARRSYRLARELISKTKWPPTQEPRQARLIDVIDEKLRSLGTTEDDFSQLAMAEKEEERTDGGILRRLVSMLKRDEARSSHPEEDTPNARDM